MQSGRLILEFPPQVHGNLAHVMRRIMLPNSNVIFAAQSDDPAKIKTGADPFWRQIPLASSYDGWMDG